MLLGFHKSLKKKAISEARIQWPELKRSCILNSDESSSLKRVPRNPSLPPFSKGGDRVSPFEKGGLRGICQIPNFLYLFIHFIHRYKLHALPVLRAFRFQAWGARNGFIQDPAIFAQGPCS
jgi:hypothetical protein